MTLLYSKSSVASHLTQNKNPSLDRHIQGFPKSDLPSPAWSLHSSWLPEPAKLASSRSPALLPLPGKPMLRGPTWYTLPDLPLLKSHLFSELQEALYQLTECKGWSSPRRENHLGRHLPAVLWGEMTATRGIGKFQTGSALKWFISPSASECPLFPFPEERKPVCWRSSGTSQSLSIRPSHSISRNAFSFSSFPSTPSPQNLLFLRTTEFVGCPIFVGTTDKKSAMFILHGGCLLLKSWAY